MNLYIYQVLSHTAPSLLTPVFLPKMVMYSLTQRQNYTFILLPVDEQEPVLSPTTLPSHTDFPSEDGNIFTDTKRHLQSYL